MREETREAILAHDFDDDGVCTKCGFDGAEWHYWKTQTYEGRASDLKSPPCKTSL